MAGSNKNERFFDDNVKTESFLEYPVLGSSKKQLLSDDFFSLNILNSDADIENTNTTIIIPTLNEETNIKIIINELQSLGYSNILVIDGNSDDCTVEAAKKLGVHVVNQDGKGKGTALRQAFNIAKLSDWVIMMDADGSMNPKEIALFLESLKNGADVVKGSRFMIGGHTNDMTLFRKFGNRVFVFLVNRLLHTKYTDLCYGYAAFTKDALQKLSPHLKSTSFDIETEIFMKAKILGLNIKEVPSVEAPRLNGTTNLSAWKDGFKILKTIFREGLSKRSLQLRL
ncbi:MAG: glycosyltransferase family 2 protein [Candidatus Bathyarchaeia archaeon]